MFSHLSLVFRAGYGLKVCDADLVLIDCGSDGE